MGNRNLGRLWVGVGLAAIYAGGVLIGAERSAPTMATAAKAFMASLNEGQKSQASFSFDSEERTRWHFVPIEMHPRKGLTIGEMTEPQRRAAHELLKAGLSQRGYMTASAIMELETILGAMEATQRKAGASPARVMQRDPVRYFFSIFGTPSPTGTWGWRAEGHHVSLQFTVVNGALVAASPSFFGANPAEVREGPQKGLRILAAEEDSARALVESLDPTQRTKAVIAAEAPNDIATMANTSVTPLPPAGIVAAELTDAQRRLLLHLLDVYAGSMASDLASDRIAKVKAAGVDKIQFAWAGPIARGQKHYYRVQGPTFLIEYDNTQNDGNHIHSVWRDFSGDFGRDLLREHLRSAAHR